ncbi:MAG: hypothetical protein IPJ77_12405 [Planctomycetes bacterium]|nr:hypothetical protein [Planctomycetota bacterium]
MHSARARTRILGLAGLLLAAFTGLACPSCRTEFARASAPVPDTARAAYERGMELLDARAAEARARAEAELATAARLAPDWVAPRRALDEVARAELRGVAVLVEHRAALARRPDDPLELYLCGRLEGRAGGLRFEAAVRADPSFAWGWHGLSFAAQQSGHRSDAIAHARRAVALAREPAERAFFVANLARLLAANGTHDAAAELLVDELARGDLGARDRRGLSLLAVALGLETNDLTLRSGAYERGLELLRDEALSEDEVAELGGRLRGSRFDDSDGERLVLALSTRSSPARDRLRGELLLDAGPTPLALALIERGRAESGLEPTGPIIRAARFWARQYGTAVERWLAGLPSVVLDERRLPREPRLLAVVERTRALDSPTADPLARSRALADLGDALVVAGWFREARAVAAELAEHDLAAALALDARGLAGHEAIQGLVRVVTWSGVRPFFPSRAGRRPRSPAWERLFGPAEAPRELVDLESLLSAFAPPLERARAFLVAASSNGDTPEPAPAPNVKDALLASPRLSFAPVGEVVHPGPRFSAADERSGLGRRGEPVGGLAGELARLGRFALFGELAGAGGPDGTMLPCLYAEERSGEHLGVRWSGTIAWCEAAELKSRAGRAGAHISAAALHEGYWLDVDAVRAERTLWNELTRTFDVPGGVERVEAVLAVRGLELAPERDADDDERARERRSGAALLGEAQRVRLALLRERAAPGAVLGAVELDELVRVTAVHEEGHLCDRTRFLPIWKHLGAALAFALECGFSPQRIQEELEHRAQLTCLAEAPDPRFPLAQVLDAAEGGGSGLTPHAAGYARLLDDLLFALDQRSASDPARWSTIDRGRTLAHQLHHLGAEDVRVLARDVAGKKLR